MTDFETKDLMGQAEVPATDAPAASEPAASETEQAAEQAAPETEQTVSQPPFHTASVTPQLTLEPDPVPPEVPVAEEPHIPGSAAEPFQMPEPPHAPEPPRAEPQYQEPVYQQTQPQYGNPAPYGQPVQQPYYNKPLYNVPPAGYVQKSRLAAGLLALLFGCLGVHNYYLGYNSRGTIQLIVTLAGGLLTCGIASLAMLIWGFVEGVQILAATNPSRMYDGNGVILRD